MDEYELEEIKREIVESRSLSIKTNNLVNALASDVKSIAKRHQMQERRLIVNTTTAYVLTIAVILGFVKLLWDLRLDTVRSETRAAEERAATLEKQLKSLTARDEGVIRARRQASAFYQLIAQNKRREIIEGFTEVSKADLTPTERATFETAVERAKDELSLIAYQAGLDHARTGRWQEATQQLRESLAYKGDAAHSPSATYELARALIALGNQREAIPMLLTLSEASADREVMDDAMFLLAQAQLEIQAYNDAKTTLRTFLRRFPKSSHYLEAKGKLAETELYH
ncbi:MAG TPA: tetratricopeptide repeat protein [Polyangiaceae bacterium]|jgi:TolA-binding protein|nr:tetratricopeptide repeat protein [Polyangiaceae bacterium]